ncbi:GerAB/ArcD/ProY family transporter [Paenibacillus protaetiae]|uniref:Spore gernimation protein n=1 Tax=Paenibacillus protaetiae TaxID=2509456 RepID=A0A4P6EVZ1_9BACL|nr:endospore germination permease [Paenibacillus protaetiae]QAY65869.1 spore gernimation protein [Paenibacillus protaetiae]
MIHVSKYQIFTLMTVFQLGSTIIFGFAADAGRNAWISTLISSVLGMCIVLLYWSIFHLSGGLSLVEWCPALLGKWIGIPLAWLFPLVFLYDSARIVSDIRFLFPITILHGTPNWLIAITFLLVILYVLFSGYEVLARMSGFFFPLILLSLLLEIVLLFFSGRIHLPNLLPVLGEGWGKVWQTVWPSGLMQTYGESIEFAMFWGFVAQKKQLPFTVAGACILSGLCITLLDVLAITGMGEHVFQQMMYPSFALLKLSNVVDLLENLDAIGVSYLTLTAFTKLTLHLFAAVYCIRKLLAAAGDKAIILTSVVVAFFVSMTMVVSFNGHLEVATTVLPQRLWLPLFLYLPAVLFLMACVKQKRRSAQHD